MDAGSRPGRGPASGSLDKAFGAMLVRHAAAPRLMANPYEEEARMAPLRKPLVLALLGAGIIAGDVRSTAFVPELAMLDGAVCVPSSARAPAPPLLVAQAAKGEVSPAAKAAASAASPAAAQDQPLIPGIGTRS